jgi:hypothetical protein
LLPARAADASGAALALPVPTLARCLPVARAALLPASGAARVDASGALPIDARRNTVALPALLPACLPLPASMPSAASGALPARVDALPALPALPQSEQANKCSNKSEAVSLSAIPNFGIVEAARFQTLEDPTGSARCPEIPNFGISATRKDDPMLFAPNTLDDLRKVLPGNTGDRYCQQCNTVDTVADPTCVCDHLHTPDRFSDHHDPLQGRGSFLAKGDVCAEFIVKTKDTYGLALGPWMLLSDSH